MAPSPQSSETATALDPVLELLTRLLAQGRHATSEAAQAFRALGPGATAALIHIAIGDLDERTGLDRWRLQFLAIDLIGQVLPPEAIGPMYDRLVHRVRDERYNDEEIDLDERLTATLRRFGGAALEPGLEALTATRDQWTRVCVTGVLAKLGLRDERVRQILLRGLEVEPEWIASMVEDYGDASLLGHVIARLEAYEIKERVDQNDVDAVQDCASAIVALGGKITMAQRRKLAAVDPRAAEHAGLILFMRREGKGGWDDPGGSGEPN